jgi:hypothetical protein
MDQAFNGPEDETSTPTKKDRAPTKDGTGMIPPVPMAKEAVAILLSSTQ